MGCNSHSVPISNNKVCLILSKYCSNIRKHLNEEKFHYILKLSLRNPSFVRNMLRPIRVGLGPSSIIVALFTSSTQMFLPEWTMIDWIRRILASTVFVSTFSAGVIFRPDNLDMLNVMTSMGLDPLTFYRTILTSFGITFNANIEIKAIHGLLNIASVFMSLAILITYIMQSPTILSLAL